MRFIYDSFHKIRDKMNSFMYGRNGMDRINRGLIWIYLLLFIAGMFFVPEEGGLSVVNIVIDVLLVAILVVIVYRALSRDIPKRREENEKWAVFWWRMRTGNVDKKFTYSKAFRYVTCERCKTVCRVPAGKGKIIVICPKCNSQTPTET